MSTDAARKAHDPQVRAHALKLAAERGATYAAEATGVKLATVRSWQRRESARAQKALVRAGIQLAGDRRSAHALA